jgi:hypothetical protein
MVPHCFFVVFHGWGGFQGPPRSHTETSWLFFSRCGFTRHQKVSMSTFVDFQDAWHGPQIRYVCSQSPQNIVSFSISRFPKSCVSIKLKTTTSSDIFSYALTSCSNLHICWQQVRFQNFPTTTVPYANIFQQQHFRCLVFPNNMFRS